LNNTIIVTARLSTVELAQLALACEQAGEHVASLSSLVGIAIRKQYLREQQQLTSTDPIVTEESAPRILARVCGWRANAPEKTLHVPTERLDAVASALDIIYKSLGQE